MRSIGDRSIIKLPEGYKEFLAIYTTAYEDSYILETIEADDIISVKKVVQNQPELVFEAQFNYDIHDKSANILEDEKIIKIRKLNRKIGENLKLL
jgi:hypothetical protein